MGFGGLFGFAAFDHFLVDDLEGEALTCRVDLAVGQAEGFGGLFVRCVLQVAQHDATCIVICHGAFGLWTAVAGCLGRGCVQLRDDFVELSSEELQGQFVLEVDKLDLSSNFGNLSSDVFHDKRLSDLRFKKCVLVRTQFNYTAILRLVH